MQKKSTVRKRKKKKKKGSKNEKKDKDQLNGIAREKHFTEPLKETEKIDNQKIKKTINNKEEKTVNSQEITHKETQINSKEGQENSEENAEIKIEELVKKTVPSILELNEKKKDLRIIKITRLSYNRDDIFRKKTLDKKLPTIEKKSKRKELRLINLKIKPVSNIRARKTLDKNYSDEILNKIIREIEIQKKKYEYEDIEESIIKKEKPDHKIALELAISKNNGDNGDGTSESKEEPLFDNLFRSRESRFPSDIDSDNPYVVFLPSSENDKYIETIWIILREIFRKLTKKGKPISRIHDKKYTLEEELKAEDNIDIIEEKGSDYVISIPTNERIHTIEKNGSKKLLEIIKNRLREMKTQGLGFIIFHISKNLIEKMKKELKKESWKPEIIDLEPVFHEHSFQELKLVDEVENFIQEIDIDRIKKQSASYFWGFVEPVNDDKWTNGKTFDDFFGACEREFRKKLREIFKKTFIIINSEKIILKDHKKVTFKDSEGPLHKRIKVLVLKHLLDNKNCRWEDIKVEQSSPNTDGIEPDILIGDIIPYEIETFYGRGEPDERIIELIKKYQNNTTISKIKIIITNLDAILWYNEFMRIKKNKRKENMDIEFLTLDLKNNQLIKIENLRSIFLKNLSVKVFKNSRNK